MCPGICAFSPVPRYLLCFLAARRVTPAMSPLDVGADIDDRGWRPHPLIGKYCLSCHDAEEQAANLVLEGLDLDQRRPRRRDLGEGRTQGRGGRDAPAGNPRPSKAEADDFIATLTQRLDAATPAPAPVVLRRLNRTEYTNVIRDLLALKIDAATLLPPDAASKGFDNIAAVLSTSPALIQGYLDAGMKISRLAVGDLSIEPERSVYRAPRVLNQETQLEGLPLGTRGGIRVSHFFPLDARVRAVGRGGPGASGFMRRAPGPMPEVDLTVDGRAVPLTRDGPTRDSTDRERPGAHQGRCRPAHAHRRA